MVSKPDFPIEHAGGLTCVGDRSIAREAIKANNKFQPIPAQTCAVRGIVPRNAMLAGTMTRHLIEKEVVTVFTAPNNSRSFVGYPIQQGKLFNMAMPVPTAPVGHQYTATEVRDFFSDFAQPVREALESVNDFSTWGNYEIPPLATWASENGAVTLMGDAAHVMGAHLAQGAVSAVEDAVVLAECLRRMRSRDDLIVALHHYQAIRKPRAELIAERSRTLFGLHRGDTEIL